MTDTDKAAPVADATPEFSIVDEKELPANKRTRKELTAEETTRRDAYVTALTNLKAGNRLRGSAVFDTPALARASVAKVRRLIETADLGEKIVRTNVVTNGAGYSWTIKLGEAAKKD